MRSSTADDAAGAPDLSGLPGADLVAAGLEDLHAGQATEYSLLVLVASPRLRGLGFDVPDLPGVAQPYEHRLYELLEARHDAGAYSRYNAHLRRMASFCQALERERSRG